MGNKRRLRDFAGQRTSDPASAWVRRTPRQRVQAAARYDREARATLEAMKERRAQAAREAAVIRARKIVDLFSPAIARGHRIRGTPFSRDELTCMQESLIEAWATLRRLGREVVTVLP